MAPLADLNNEISNEEEMDTPIDVKMINTLPGNINVVIYYYYNLI